jgi:CHAT domain-containing protein/membrane-bound inhibitor of C-type lysozyme
LIYTRKSILFELFFFATLLANGQSWRSSYELAKDQYAKENYAEAYTTASTSLKQYRDENGATNENYAAILRLLSNISFTQEKFTEGLEFVNQELQILANKKDSTYAGALANQAQFNKALGHYEAAIQSLTECRSILLSYSSESNRMIENEMNLGIVYYLQNDNENAIHWLSHSLLLANQKKEYPDNSIEALYYFGGLQLESAETENAIETFSLAKQQCESAGLNTGLTYAQVLSGLAKAYSRNKNYPVAENTFATAQTICEKAGDKNDNDYFEILNSRALNLQLMGKTPQASELLTKINSSASGKASLATSLSNHAAIDQANGDYAKAEALYREALAKYDLQDKTALPGYAETLKNFAVMYSAQGNYSEGLAKISEAKELIQKLYGPQHRKYLNALNIYGMILAQKGDFQTARETYKNIVAVIASMPVKPMSEKLAALNGLAATFQREGQFTKSDSIYKDLLQQYSSGFLSQDAYYLSTLNNFAASKQVQGQLLAAVDLLKKQAAATAKIYGKNSVEYAQSQDNLVIVYLKRGDLSNTKPTIDSTLQILENESKKSSVDYANGLINLGHYFELTGEYTKAEPYLKNARDIIQSLRGKDSPDYAGALNELALLYQKLGNYRDALNLLKESKEIIEKNSGKTNSEYATAVQNLATLYQLEGKYDLAEPLLKETLELDKRLVGETSPQYAIALQNLATLYQKLGNQKEAQGIMEQVLQITSKTLGTEHPSYITTLSNLAALYQDKGNFDLAETTWKQSIALRKKVLGDRHPDYAKSLYGLAGVYHARGQLEEAKKYYEPVIASFQAQVKNFFSTLSEKEKGAFYAKIKPVFEAYQDFCFDYIIHNPNQQAETLKQLYDLQLATKAILLEASSKVRARILASNDTTVISQFKKWLAVKQEMVRYYNYTQAEREQQNINLASLEALANDLEKKLAEKSDAFRSQVDKNAITWQQVQNVLQPGEAAIEILRVKKRFSKDSIYYAGLLINKASVNPELILWPTGNHLENRWFKYHRNTIKFQFIDTLSYKNFWLPIQKKLSGENLLYISCDGVFNKVNFNSLYNPATKQWIIDNFTIRQLSSTRELLEQRQANPEKLTALLFGYADFNLGLPNVQSTTKRGTARAYGFDGEEIPMLPATEKEINGIYQVLKSRQWDVLSFEKEAATEERMKEIENPSLIHIATHGFFLSDVEVNENDELLNNPLFRSGVLLAGAGLDRSVSPLKEDGVLTAYEAMNLNLDKTELVVLSACETGLGEIRNGEGVYGLQRSFIVAGARTVLMSLWQVDDTATQELMNSFYTLWLSGMEKHKAFREAQLKLKSQYEAPYYWGAFVLIGN